MLSCVKASHLHPPSSISTCSSALVSTTNMDDGASFLPSRSEAGGGDVETIAKVPEDSLLLLQLQQQDSIDQNNHAEEEARRSYVVMMDDSSSIGESSLCDDSVTTSMASKNATVVLLTSPRQMRDTASVTSGLESVAKKAKTNVRVELRDPFLLIHRY